jgi:endonuclease/exonuclease/phosphatase family metal-dependent hydrolase
MRISVSSPAGQPGRSGTLRRVHVPTRSLRILSLNLWGGQALAPLLAYIQERAPETDLFCLQETVNCAELIPLECGFRTTLYQELADLLPEFDGAFDPIVTWDQPVDADRSDGRTVPIPFGLATFARRSLPILDRRGAVIVEHRDNLDAVPGLHPITRRLQCTEIRVPGGSLLVGNYHGIARPGTKLDTEDRLEQSREVRRIADAHAGPVVLIGDFNLLPETESVRLLAAGLRNLVIERAIPSTRSRLNPYHGTPQEQPHADYAFVSPALPVADFRVPDVCVSDHLPMVLTLAW